MSKAIIGILFILILIVTIPIFNVEAQFNLLTDKSEYDKGDTVQIKVQNAKPNILNCRISVSDPSGQLYYYYIAIDPFFSIAIEDDFF